jgi:hypothetical protein
MRERVATAEAALDECYVLLTVRALPPSEMEALLSEHPATDGKGLPFNQNSFMPALLARCVFDDEDSAEPAMTAIEWAEEIAKGSSSMGEVGALFQACWQVNDRSPDARIPKGSTRTSS